MKKLLAAVLGYAIILLLILAVLVPLTLFCGGLMRAAGLYLRQPRQFSAVLCHLRGLRLPAGDFLQSLSQGDAHAGTAGARGEKILFLILDTVSTTVVMLIIDDLMDSVHATDLSILAVAIALAFLSLDNREKKGPAE